MKKIYLCIGCLVCFLHYAFSQQTAKRFNQTFEQVTIAGFITSIEAQSNYHFFYDAKAFDSLRISLQAKDEPLEAVLNKAFANTLFTYAITWDGQVFLTRGKPLVTDFAKGFLPGEQPLSAGTQAAPAGYTDEKGAAENRAAERAAAEKEGTEQGAGEQEKIIKASTENKTYEIGYKSSEIIPGNASLSGYIRNISSGEAIAGASLTITDLKKSVLTDPFGYFTLLLPRGRQVLLIRAAGMQDSRRQVVLYSDGKLNIEIREQINSLREVKISAGKVANVRSVELGVTRLDIKRIKEIPALFGEADILRVVLTLPGVTSVGEATTGFNVRGGAADENLILLGGSTIYNPAHFFGFFAAFNPDIVKDITLYKGSIPEKFGGRLSSVLEISNREGNKKKFTGTAGIGLLTSSLSVEGPIVQDKTSFIIGARTTYSDWLLHLLPDAYKNSSASFNDFNLGINHQIDEQNNLYLTGYLSNDRFKLNSDTAYAYSNKSIGLKWKHNFNAKFYGVFSAGIDHYDYTVKSSANPVNAFGLGFNINQDNFKSDFTYLLNARHTLSFGLSSTLYKINPGSFEPLEAASLVEPEVVPAQKAVENAVYLGDKYDITDQLSLSAGIRYNIYSALGAQTINHYAADLPRSAANATDSTTYKNGSIINTYQAPDIRISARYSINENLSLKAGYNTLHQYIHLLSNSTSISPTDVYTLSDPNIKPEKGDQVSLGLFRNTKGNTIEMSVEVYYKRLRNYLDYKSGAVLLLNQHIERDVINTQGKAYGAEFFLKKTSGKLNGYVSYTYSRTYLKQDDPNAGEVINAGKYYPANYDKPNIFNFTGNYRFSHRYSTSLDMTYSTGRPITLPVAKYQFAGAERVLYSNRNAYRIPDYFRSDFSLNIEGNHKVHQKTHNTWTVGVYNLTGRQNAYSTFFTEQSGKISGYKLSIFANPIPFINYKIRF